MRYFAIFLISLFSVFLVGCESSEEKAERIRLESLYALDNYKVAQSFEKSSYSGSAYGKEYLEIKRECAKEELKNKGMWCEKFAEINVHLREIESNARRERFERANIYKR